MSRSNPSLLWLRPLVGLLAVYVWVTYRFDLEHLTHEGGPLAGWTMLTQLPPFLMVAVTATVVLEWPAVRRNVGQLQQEVAPPGGPLPYLLIAGATAAFLFLTGTLFARRTDVVVSLWMLGVWGGVTLALVSTMLNLVIPYAAQPRLLRLLARPLAVGLAGGGLAWAASQQVGALWADMAQVTLYSVRGLLGFLGQPVDHVAGTTIMGLRDFYVNIAPECSGYEGVGLTTAVLGAYVFRFRDELRFPNALLLPLVGAVVVWLLNNVRIAALLMVGAYVSKPLAVGGFHAKAGWLFFCATAIGMVVAAQHVPWLLREGKRSEAGAVERPAAPYLLPLIVLLAAGLLTGMLVVGFDHLYPVRIGVTAVAAVFSWKVLKPDTLRPHSLAVAMGLAVLLLWLAIVPADPELDAIRRATLSELHPAWLYTWLVVRVLGSAVVVPVAEELAFRGFLLRRVVDPEFDRVEYRGCSIWALMVSSLAFGALHSESWLAGSLAGLGYGFVVMRTGRLYDAVFAHGLTNAAIAAYVLATGHYYLW